MWRGLVVALCMPLSVGLVPAPTAAQEAAPLGTISGTVVDKASGDPIIEAGVEVIEQKKTVRTDLDGRFSVKVPPGTYEVRFFAPLFQGSRIQKVVVERNEVTKLSTSLAAAVAGVEVVEVIAQAKKATEATQLLKRQRADVIEDNIGAETIQKSPDSDAAEVVERLAAVTVEDGKYLYVRGLGERYSMALLNGSRLSSPDPEKRVVPLDLFPAGFIESMSISKSYTPDLPGDFSGGLLDIQLREYAEKLEGSLSVSSGGNTATTFKRFQTYRGLGRPLPSIFPDRSIQIPSAPLQHYYANSLPNVWVPEGTTAPPDAGATVALGNSWGNFGFSLAGVYANEYQNIRDQIQRSIVNGGNVENPTVQVVDNFRYEDSTQSTRLGGLFTSAYKPSDAHKLAFRALVDSNTDNQVLFGKGTDNQGRASETTRLQRTTEELDFGQLAGSHNFNWILADWRSAFSRTAQDIPDSRNLTYTGANFDQLAFDNDATGGLRAFSTLDEYQTDSGVDFTVPFRTQLPRTDVWSGLAAKFKFGAAYDYRDRDYVLRLFRYRRNGANPFQPPEQLLNPANVGETPGVIFEEQTQPRDKFHATQEIIGGYGMLDLPIVRDRLRLIAGVREEYSYIVLNTADDQGNPKRVTKRNVNPLPAVNLVYSPRIDMNVRAAFSQTVSRPEFRELTPALFPQPRGFRPLVGNPQLVQSDITNWDLRWEWFLSGVELLSVGGFYKTIDQPIEVIVLQAASNLIDSFQNAESATLKGVEFEIRKNLGFLSPYLSNVLFSTNVAYVDSKVTVPRSSTLQVQTAAERRLVGQSPFVVNAVLEYALPRYFTARLLYNTAANSIQEAGANGLPDIFEVRRDDLDAVLIFPLNDTLNLPVTLKFSAENLLNDRYQDVQGGTTQSQSFIGTKFVFSLSYIY